MFLPYCLHLFSHLPELSVTIFFYSKLNLSNCILKLWPPADESIYTQLTWNLIVLFLLEQMLLKGKICWKTSTCNDLRVTWIVLSAQQYVSHPDVIAPDISIQRFFPLHCVPTTCFPNSFCLIFPPGKLRYPRPLSHIHTGCKEVRRARVFSSVEGGHHGWE